MPSNNGSIPNAAIMALTNKASPAPWIRAVACVKEDTPSEATDR